MIRTDQIFSQRARPVLNSVEARSISKLGMPNEKLSSVSLPRPLQRRAFLNGTWTSPRQQTFARHRAHPARRQRSRENQKGNSPAIVPITFDAEPEENAARCHVQHVQTNPRPETRWQKLPIGPGREQADKPAREHAGEKIGRRQQRDQSRGSVRAAREVKAKRPRQHDEPAKAGPA